MSNLVKYLSPWNLNKIYHNNYLTFVNAITRYSFNKKNSFHIFQPTNSFNWTFYIKGEVSIYNNQAAAIIAADNWFINHGYILLTEEQYEKYSLLI